MSSSPFELFRRNLKPLMVFLTLLALVSFVILPSIAMYQQQNVGYGGSAPSNLASYDGGDFDFSKVSYFTRNHFATTQFLRDLAETTIARGGLPKVADFQYDARQNAIQALGINSNPSDQASVRTLMFANEAKKVGLELDDTAIRNWLTLYSDGRLSDSEINGVLASSSRSQMGQVQVYEQLRTQLLAQAYQRQAIGGLTSGGLPIVPPAQQWELFLRLNRRAVADAYAVNVADFIEKTNAKPSDSQIKSVYEVGRTVFPNDESSKPAFRRPYTANVEYISGSLNDFIEREIGSLTEDQLRVEYQDRLNGGEFKLPETPAEAPAESPADAPTEESPAKTPSEPAVETPEDAKEKTDSEAPKVVEPTLEAPAVEPPATEPAKADSGQNRWEGNGIRLVAMQSAAETQASDVKSEDTKPEDAKSEDAKSEDAKSEDAKAEDVKTEPQPAEQPTAEKTDEPVKTESPAAFEGEEEKQTEKAPKMASEAKSDEAPKTEEPKVETPKVESFESVRDEVARSLAMGPALDKLDSAVSEVTKTMQTYFTARAIAGNNKDKIPPRPDLKALAAKLGMKHVATGMTDVREIQNDPVSLSFGVGTGMQRGDGFVQQIYSKQTPAFKPVRTVDDQAQISYVSWKTDEKDAFIPKLKDIPDEVIAAIRTAEARALAKAEADRLAKEFAKSDKPAKELVPADRTSQYFEALGPFSWMQSLGFGMQAFMGNVPELDRVGDAFMRQVFTSDRNEWGVAANMPETVFYIVRPTEFSPSTDELHQRFTQVSQRMQTMSLAVEEAIKIRDGHYEALDKKTGFKWNEEALDAQ